MLIKWLIVSLCFSLGVGRHGAVVGLWNSRHRSCSHLAVHWGHHSVSHSRAFPVAVPPLLCHHPATPGRWPFTPRSPAHYPWRVRWGAPALPSWGNLFQVKYCIFLNELDACARLNYSLTFFLSVRFLLQLVGVLLDDIASKQVKVDMSEQQHTFYCQQLGTLLMCLIHIFKSGAYTRIFTYLIHNFKPEDYTQ